MNIYIKEYLNTLSVGAITQPTLISTGPGVCKIWANLSQVSFWVTCFSFTVFTCHHVKLFSPLQPCSLHPIHRITRDAGVSIATAVQAVAIGLWWGLVAVMCVHECICGCSRVFASEKDMEIEERQKKKKKNTWEFVSIFTTETRLTAYSSWPFAHRACTHTHTLSHTQ